MNHQNISQLEEMYEFFLDMDIDSWKVIGLEPIGRAKLHPDLMLTAADQERLFSFIRERREEGFPVTYGCSHFLGTGLEREVRPWYFLCTAGVYTASITAAGDICACLDIERSPLTVQGNILTDSFTHVWKNKYRIFRQPLSALDSKCRQCPQERWCAGGSCHSFDYDNNVQQMCFRRILF